jgi:hypothetical protein
MSDAPLPDPLERFLQQPPGAPPSPELRELLLQQTSVRLRKSRWRRWPIAVGAAAAIVLALVSGYLGLRWSQVEPVREFGIGFVETKPEPALKPPPVIAAAPVHPLVLENNAFDTEDDRQRVRLYFQAGDLYFEQNQDVESALRCYHQALAYCDANELEIDIHDNYLVMSLKRERRREQ